MSSFWHLSIKSTTLLCLVMAAYAEDQLPQSDAAAPPSPNQGAPIPNRRIDGATSSSKSSELTPPAPIAGETLIVQGRADSLIGVAGSASQGVVGRDELDTRPLFRNGEIMEAVPGMIVTQHSGSGKANQYFLRGFNLDHGTDFAFFVDGVPVNMPTNAHGQGFSDLNFVIPELVDTITYRKGVYYADVGDFSSAGTANLQYVNELPHGIASATVGFHDYYRGMVADSFHLGHGVVLYAAEGEHYRGPFDASENFNKVNGLLKYSVGSARGGYSVTGYGYASRWNSTDQIPARAVASGLIDRTGELDPSDGGRSQRDGITAEAHLGDDDQMTRFEAYAVRYRLSLWSDFTYFLNDPVNGDQFNQIDKRSVIGGKMSHAWSTITGPIPTDNLIGIDVRNDLIPTDELNHTKDRVVISRVSDSHVVENAGAIYGQSTEHWLSVLRSTVGLRADLYRFSVHSDNSANSGEKTAGIISPKVGIVAGPWEDTEYYLNGGLGFHSNDARGVTETVAPGTGSPTNGVTALVRTKGAEMGIRTTFLPGLQSTLSVWYLHINSELTFNGDAGDTSPSRPSNREGIEFSNFWNFLPGWSLDADYAYTRSRYSEHLDIGDRIPGALEQAATGGIAYRLGDGIFSSLRGRFFGPRPLIEDNSAQSSPTFILEAELGYRWHQTSVALQGFNLLNRKDHDIDYVYVSRLKGEPAGGISDVHFHPVEPFNLRLNVTCDF